MNEDVTEELYKRFCGEYTQSNTVDFWLESDSRVGTYDEAREVFFDVLERLLKGGHIKLAKHGIFLEGTIDEQIERFRQAFPSKDKAPFLDPHPRTGREEFDTTWFYHDNCPGGAVWINPDGSLYWT